MICNSHATLAARSSPDFETLKRLKRKYAGLADTLHFGLISASKVPLQVIKMPTRLSGEVCLFVTYAIEPALKSPVTHYLENLLRAGLPVILVSNCDSPAQGLVMTPTSARQPIGIFIRNNQGFGFAAWSHTMQLCGVRSGWTRYSLFDASEDFDPCEVGLSQDPQGPEDTLIFQSLPYIKTPVIRQQSGNTRLQALSVPARAQGRV